MVPDTESLKDLITLWNQGQALMNDLVGVATWPLTPVTTDLFLLQLDRATLPMGQTGDRQKECRFAVTVKPDQTDFFTGTHPKI